MRSIRLHGTGNLQIYDESMPVTGVGEKLVRINSVGVCVGWIIEITTSNLGR